MVILAILSVDSDDNVIPLKDNRHNKPIIGINLLDHFSSFWIIR
ncbi:hypothetical protein GAPWKB11_0130 [Gilliamella apicola]|nr:hypothetical protein GAPWKB11_0130 [Gilliamella apicola]